MSMFIAIRSDEEAFLLTDGSCTRIVDGIQNWGLYKSMTKIYPAKRELVAFTGRGNLEVSMPIIDHLIRVVDNIGAKAFLDRLQEIVDNIECLYGCLLPPPDDRDGHIDVAMAGFIPGHGPFHRVFSSSYMNVNQRKIDGWQVVVTGDIPGRIFGKWPSNEELVAAGIPHPTAAESLLSWLEKWGADIVEILRNKPDHFDPVTGDPRYIIGCHLDMTVIDATGIRTARLRTWPDVIGEPIDPLRRAA